MQKPSTLLALPVMNFHQRLQVVQSGFKSLGELLVPLFASIHTDVQRSPEDPGPSNFVACRGAIQESGPWVD